MKLSDAEFEALSTPTLVTALWIGFGLVVDSGKSADIPRESTAGPLPDGAGIEQTTAGARRVALHQLAQAVVKRLAALDAPGLDADAVHGPSRPSCAVGVGSAGTEQACGSLVRVVEHEGEGEPVGADSKKEVAA